MRCALKIAAQVFVCILVIVLSWSTAMAQAPTLDEQLRAQYKAVKMGSDSHGPAVVEAGTVLKIQKGGILSVPYSDVSVTPTHYQNGQVKTPNALFQKGLGFGMKKFGKEQNTHLFPVGDKVYPSHIDVNANKDTVTMGIVACDSCNNTNPTTFFKADVVFQFAKGSLAKTNASEVEDTIGQLFAIDEGGDQQAGGDQQGGNGGQGNNQTAQAGQGQQQQQAPPPEPAQIEKGQTPDQVKGALGPPDKIVNLGAKQIFVYKDLKVTFVNGKVTDVQ